MIQMPRETEKKPKEKTLEEIIKEQEQKINDLQYVIDDLILNGGGL